MSIYTVSGAGAPTANRIEPDGNLSLFRAATRIGNTSDKIFFGAGVTTSFGVLGAIIGLALMAAGVVLGAVVLGTVGFPLLMTGLAIFGLGLVIGAIANYIPKKEVTQQQQTPQQLRQNQLGQPSTDATADRNQSQNHVIPTQGCRDSTTSILGAKCEKLELEIEVSKENLLCDYLHKILLFKTEATTETRESIDAIIPLLQDLDGFSEIVENKDLDETHKSSIINAKYKIGIHRNFEAVLNNINVIKNIIINTDISDISIGWVEEKFGCQYPCIEAKINHFFEGSNSEITTKTNPDKSVEENIGKYLFIFLNEKECNDDAVDGVEFYDWVINQDAFVGKTVSNGVITTRAVMDFILDNKLFLCDFSEESINKIKELKKTVEKFTEMHT